MLIYICVHHITSSFRQKYKNCRVTIDRIVRIIYAAWIVGEALLASVAYLASRSFRKRRVKPSTYPFCKSEMFPLYEVLENISVSTVSITMLEYFMRPRLLFFCVYFIYERMDPAGISSTSPFFHGTYHKVEAGFLYDIILSMNCMCATHTSTPGIEADILIERSRNKTSES